MEPGLPECGLLAHIVPLLIDQGQPLPHPLRLGLGGAVLGQVAPNHVDAHGHALVAVKVQQELSVVLDNLLKLLNVTGNTLIIICYQYSRNLMCQYVSVLSKNTLSNSFSLTFLRCCASCRSACSSHLSSRQRSPSSCLQFRRLQSGQVVPGLTLPDLTASL